MRIMGANWSSTRAMQGANYKGYVMFVYCVLSDQRENHKRVLLVTKDIRKAYKKARQYIVGRNKDKCNWWIDPSIRSLSDRDFCHKYISAWLVSPSIMKIKLS